MRFFLKKAGKIPGDIETDKTEYQKSTLKWIQYNKELFKEDGPKEIDQIGSPDTSLNNWIDVLGLNDSDTLKQLANKFSIHPLIMEDVINVDHLPKCEFSESHFTDSFPH